MSGLVYILQWSPGIYKIGCTARRIEQRWDTARVRRNILFTIETDEQYPTTLERQLHEEFAEFRIGFRELFKLDANALARIAAYPKCKQYKNR